MHFDTRFYLFSIIGFSGSDSEDEETEVQTTVIKKSPIQSSVKQDNGKLIER